MNPCPRRPTALPVLGITLASLAVVSACAETTRPIVRLEWDPEGVWTAEVSGTRNGAALTDTLELGVLRGNVFPTPDSSVFRVDLLGLWEWGGFEGEFVGYWLMGRDEAASTGDACPDNRSTCSVVIRLFPENSACPEGATGQTVPIELAGWFENENRMVGASLEGTFWEIQSEPPPCTGEILVSFDTSVELRR